MFLLVFKPIKYLLYVVSAVICHLTACGIMIELIEFFFLICALTLWKYIVTKSQATSLSNKIFGTNFELKPIIVINVSVFSLKMCKP